MKKIVKIENLDESLLLNKNIVLCHGVFDLLHIGHVRHFKEARKLGEFLAVSITPDEYVNKGPNRPRFPLLVRAQMLAELEIVDLVIINNSHNAINVISKVKPKFYVKGPDYTDSSLDITGEIIKEKIACDQYAVKIHFTTAPTESSTKLINNFFSELSSEERDSVNHIKSSYSFEDVGEIVNKFSNLNVLVVGEPIIDTYVYCNPQNISSKSPSISANFLYEENYPGGVLAVALHLSKLGCKVSLLAPTGGENFYNDCLNENFKDHSIEIINFKTKEKNTPRKTRFLAPVFNQRIFELTDLSDKIYSKESSDKFIELFIKKSEKVDLVILLDFGHGLWEGEILESIKKIKTFIALNVQTNSSNYGFNLYSKHQKFNYLVLDEREARLAMHDRLTDKNKLIHELSQKIKNADVSITLGSSGSTYLKRNYPAISMPTLFTNPVDTTGAGDAYFTITSLMTYLRCEPEIIIFLGNIYAGLKTKIIGNKKPVDKIIFLKTIKSLLT